MSREENSAIETHKKPSAVSVAAMKVLPDQSRLTRSRTPHHGGMKRKPRPIADFLHEWEAYLAPTFKGVVLLLLAAILMHWG